MHSDVTFFSFNRHYIMSIDSFHKIILPLKDKLFRLAYSIVREHAEAEDIVQDLLLKLWSRKEDWNYIDNLEAYCFRATKNMALDRLASQAIRKTGTLDKKKEELYFVEHQSPHSEMVRKEQHYLIERCIDELPENQRLVFHLREIEGFSYKEISESLSISGDLVKITLHRARKRMKELLSEYK